VHDPAKTVLDLAVVVALGGDCLADAGMLRAVPELFGPVRVRPGDLPAGPLASLIGCRPRRISRHASPASSLSSSWFSTRGYLATGPGTDPVRHDLIAEAIRLTRLIRALLPKDGDHHADAA
jgi:hypothetical protein